MRDRARWSASRAAVRVAVPVTRAYSASLVDAMKAQALAARKLRENEVFALPAEMLLMNRLPFGFYSVLARLDVEVDFAEVERRFLP